MAAREYGQYSGITRALELVGERWALLIVRDLLVGPRRYGELAAALPRIPTNILAGRLRELQAAGVIRRAPRSRVIVYELTEYGRELEPVVLALGAWGFRALGEAREAQVVTAESMTMDLRSAFRAPVAAALPATSYAARIGATELLIRVDGDRLAIEPIALSSPPPTAPARVTASDHSMTAASDLAFSAAPDAGLRPLITGELPAAHALATNAVTLLHGPRSLLTRFTTTFHLAA